MRKIWTIILLTTYVFPSVCGWKEVDLVNLASIIDHRFDQKVVRNLLSQSKIIVCESPNLTKTCVKKRLTVASAVMLLFQDANNVILEN
jgi:hypothetical protein